LGAFFAGLAFLPDLLFLGATWAPRALARGFFVAFGCSVTGASAVSVVSVFDVMLFLLCGITVMTSITLVRWESKANL
jgi:hypothetical protein